MIARLCIAALVSCTFACAQSSLPSASSGKPLSFEVVSIRPSGSDGSRTSWITTPDGYRVAGQSVISTIMIVYFPQGWSYWSPDRISGAPGWLHDRYDINAKVSDDDLAEWQKQGVNLDSKPMLRAMLQTMLADRFHLVAHMVPGPAISGWSLEVGKHAPHLTESKPDPTLPPGPKMHDGGILVPMQPGANPHFNLYGATIADLAQALSVNGHVVQDHTGLTGHYDLVIDWVSDPNSKLPPGFLASDDPDPISHWNIEGLGLKRTPLKIPAETLVIDHIERPSEN